MKKKFLILTLCFTLVFSSINYKNTYADGGVISAPILATVATLAIASGVVLSDNNDLYDIGRVFYDKYKNRWNEVQQIFDVGVAIGKNQITSVSKEFLELVSDCFDGLFIGNESLIYTGLNGLDYIELSKSEIPYYYYVDDKLRIWFSSTSCGMYDLSLQVVLQHYESGGWFNTTSKLVSLDNIGQGTYPPYPSDLTSSEKIAFDVNGYSIRFYVPGRKAKGETLDIKTFSSFWYNKLINSSLTIDSVGAYNPGFFDDVEDDKIDVYVPGDLSVLPGLNSDSVLNNPTYDLPVGGVVTVPGVSNPSIDYDNSISFPVVDTPTDTPTDTPFSAITDYIIGLVVPSDMYWTDTFNSLQSNFISSFPIVDMSSFNSLSINGKPFPNIDVNIMGSKGRIVNGDTVNSIVDWLRPIIAGFVFLCLMFFNYRKLYKLIRNSEPFEGIGKVENHAN